MNHTTSNNGTGATAAEIDYDWSLIVFLGLILHSITFWGILAYYGAIDYAFGTIGL